MKKKYDESDGVWRTIGGRKVFIRKGQSLSDAMKESGKFKKKDEDDYKSDRLKYVEENDKKMMETYKKAKNMGMSNETATRVALNKRVKEIEYTGQDGKTHLMNNYEYPKERDEYHKYLQDKYGTYKEEEIKNSNGRTNYKKLSNNEVYEEAWKLRDKTKDYNLKNKIDERLDRIDRANRRGEGYAEKPTNELREILKNDNKYKGLTEEGKRIASGNFKNQEEKDMWEKAGRDTQELLKGEKEKYKSTKHEGFGDYNDDYIPVYNNNIDYTGDFSRANLSKLSNEELTSALNKQSELYDEAVNERLGDQRTRNGKMDKIFNTAKKQKYESGMSAINNEMKNRNMPRYNIYGDNGEVRVSSPTKEMAEKQLANMRETDKQLQKEYGWDKLPDYTMVEESKTGFDSEDKKGAFDFTQDEVDRAYSTMREKMQRHMDNDDRKWSAREYTNAEFLAHMEDANWHSELHQLEDANLTEKELTYIKNKTSLSSYGVGNELTGKANVQKMIDEAKNNSSIQKQNKAMLGNKYKGKGMTPNLVYSSGRRIDIDSQGNATIWKDGKIERKTRLPENVTGDKVKDYFDTYLPQLDNSAIENAYQQYLREHKDSKMSLATFKRNYKK